MEREKPPTFSEFYRSKSNDRVSKYTKRKKNGTMVQFLINIKGTIVMLKNSSDVKLVYKDDERVQHIHENLFSAMA